MSEKGIQEPEARIQKLAIEIRKGSGTRKKARVKKKKAED